MEKPKVDATVLYTTVANALPQEGRDFSIDTGYANDRPLLTVTALTDIGQAWVPHLVKALSGPLGRNGFSVSVSGGATAQEVLTVEKIRQQVEAEAESVRKAKIRAAEEDSQKKRKAAEDARKEQVAKDGEVAPISREVMAAGQAAQAAAGVEARLKRIDSRIPAIREEIYAAARTAAKDDEKHGRDWSVDMNAPLTSLFERQDVSVKIKERENLIYQMATRAVEDEELRERAIQASKQYIIPK